MVDCSNRPALNERLVDSAHAVHTLGFLCIVILSSFALALPSSKSTKYMKINNAQVMQYQDFLDSDAVAIHPTLEASRYIPTLNTMQTRTQGEY